MIYHDDNDNDDDGDIIPVLGNETINDNDDIPVIIPIRVPHDERMKYDNTIAIMQLLVLYQDIHNDDATTTMMQLVVPYDVHDDRFGHIIIGIIDHDTSINGDLISILIFLFRLVYRVQVQVQAKYEDVSPANHSA